MNWKEQRIEILEYRTKIIQNMNEIIEEEDHNLLDRDSFQNREDIHPQLMNKQSE